ncbi:MAG: prephenate dehydratase [Planctomycetes bacterium]|nr:prephenate dehydratase [Planctomycetota bacterium]
MAKKKTKAAPKQRRPAQATTVPAVRTQIDRLDRELLKLIAQRTKLAVAEGKLRQAEGEPVFDATRDEEVLERVEKANKSDLSRGSVRAVFRELLSGCRAMVRPLRVAFLGPTYSFSHLAAIHRFGQSVELVPVGSIAAVFEEVNRGHSDYGLVPVENSTDGRVADTLEMFARLPVRVCGEVELQIHHTLLGKGPREEIKEIYSKPQALSQCRNWMARHLPAARTIEVTSTSTAAQLAREKPGAAAVASLQAGIHYGLGVLAENIEDNPSNATRFAVIGNHSAKRTGCDRTAMMFQVEHRPGTLAEAMGIFKRNRLNLTWIESFPIPGPNRGYLFFVEMEGHENDARVRRAIASLERKALRLSVLGSFPAAPPVG